jgi:competence protein ComEC
MAPDSAWTAAQHDANETSVVLRVTYHDVAFLLTGDAEANEEQWILANTDPELLRADVLKLGHHGSRTSSTSPFLDAVAPRLGVVSVGAGNTYGHPSPETLEAFAERGIPVLRTDRDGGLVVTTDGRIVEVQVGRERWALPSRK